MTATASDEGSTCPSSPAAPGAVLLGIVGPTRIAYVTPELRVSEELLDELRASGPPEQRFRFADACAKSACAHWTGQQCRLIDQVLASAEEAGALLRAELPRCSVRASCRWFAQRGAAACGTCPLVVTDRTPQQ